MKTPDEIKNGLECSVKKMCIGKKCPYWKPYDENSDYSCIRESRRDALALIQKLEADNAQQARCIENLTDKLNATNDALPRWISVEERLPEGICIAVNDMGSMIIGYIGEDKRSKTGYSCEDEQYYMPSVTHWMPLPEPPVEE